MKPLRYGPEILNWDAHPHEQFTDVKLAMGEEIGKLPRARKARYVATFELFGISVVVTDQSSVNHFYDLTSIGKDKGEVEPFCERILFIALKQDPLYLEERLAYEFERGVQEGRKQKVKEFRKVLSD